MYPLLNFTLWFCAFRFTFFAFPHPPHNIKDSPLPKPKSPNPLYPQNPQLKTQNCELSTSHQTRRGVQKSRIFSNISPYFSNISPNFSNIFERFRTFSNVLSKNLRIWCEKLGKPARLMRKTWKNLRVWCELIPAATSRISPANPLL